MTKTDPTPTVDLEKVRGIATGLSSVALNLDFEEISPFLEGLACTLIRLADEVERLRREAEGYRLMVCRKACKMHYPVPNGERSPFEENAQMRGALEKIEKECRAQLSVGIGLSTGYNATIHEIARAALEEKP